MSYYPCFLKGAAMELPPWLADVRDWYGKLWIAPEARGDSRQPRRVPGWLPALLPYLLVAAAVAVLLIAIAVKR
jgi:hypothetical protein